VKNVFQDGMTLVVLTAAILIGTPNDSTSQVALTRPQAQSVINASAAFATVRSIALLEKAHEDGVAEGLFARPDYWSFTLTSEGQKFFVLPGGNVMALLPGGPGYSGALVNLPTPAKREVIAVTGITSDGPNLQRVLFQWKYSGLSDVVARYSGQGSAPHDGIALLRLYDDGWRLEKVVELKESGRVPFRADMNRTRRTEEVAREAARVKEEAERARREVERGRAERERVAKTSTRTLASYTFVREQKSPGWIGYLEVVTQTLEITDAGINVLTTQGFKENPASPPIIKSNYISSQKPSQSTAFVGYWEIKGVSIVDLSIDSNLPDGKPDLLIETARYSSGRLKVWQDRSESTDMRAALDSITKAQKEWNDKFPDRLNWYPAGGAAGTSGSPPANIAAPARDAPQSGVANAGAAVLVRVGGAIRPPNKTKHVNPERPASAVGTSGVVVIEVTISVDGKVQDAKVVRSVPGLDQAALMAVRQWEFEPPIVNGVPSPLIMTVTVNFTP